MTTIPTPADRPATAAELVGGELSDSGDPVPLDEGDEADAAEPGETWNAAAHAEQVAPLTADADVDSATLDQTDQASDDTDTGRG